MMYKHIKDITLIESMDLDLCNALISKYDYEYKSAEATIKIYLNNSVGIGEHPQHIEEMDKLVKMMVDAMDNKKLVEQTLIPYVKSKSV